MMYARSWTRTETLWTPGACNDFEKLLIQETHRLNGQIAKALSEYSPWLSVVKGGAFPALNE